MRLIPHLPGARSGLAAILVGVDRLTQMVQFLLTVTAEDTAVALYRDTRFVLRTVPQAIVPDRNAKFPSVFWQELHRLLGSSRPPFGKRLLSLSALDCCSYREPYRLPVRQLQGPSIAIWLTARHRLLCQTMMIKFRQEKRLLCQRWG